MNQEQQTDEKRDLSYEFAQEEARRREATRDCGKTTKGWECPKCGTVWAPSITKCETCSIPKYYSQSDTVSSPVTDIYWGFCCACAGMCSHTGPHYYCKKHAGL